MLPNILRSKPCLEYSSFYHILKPVFPVSLFFSGLSFCDRKIADPAFVYKLLLEQATTIGCSVWWEIKNRKERYFVFFPLSFNVLFVKFFYLAGH